MVDVEGRITSSQTDKWMTLMNQLKNKEIIDKKYFFLSLANSKSIRVDLSLYSSKWRFSFFSTYSKKKRQDWLNANRCGCSYIKLIETGKSRLDIESRTSVLEESSRLFFIYYCHRTEKKEEKKAEEGKVFSLLRFLFPIRSCFSSSLCFMRRWGRRKKGEKWA
jgi:hypothetical protein